MPERPYHKSLRLQNFTVFKDVEFKFSPGVNAFVGENGTGKTHVLKALYAWQLAQARPHQDILDSMEETFQAPPTDLLRLGSGSTAGPSLSGNFRGTAWKYGLYDRPYGSSDGPLLSAVPRPVFIPAIDMMGHTKGFVEAYEEVRLDFDIICRDIVTLMALPKRNGRAEGGVIRESAIEFKAGISLVEDAFDTLGGLLGGTLEYDESGKRFYIATNLGRIPMPIVAEGVRKAATLLRLYQNGWLAPGTTLMWDEPEVNLNPVLMDEVVAAILALARSGVQVFLATHSYTILKEIDVQSRRSDKIRYFAFQRTDDGVRINMANSYLDIDPNPIERQGADLYDRGIEKRIAGSGSR